MFRNCKALTTAPALPETTLKEDCYYGMFCYCTALTTAPVLPATTLVADCYKYMFYGCSSLNAVTCLATEGFGAEDCLGSWLEDTANNGILTVASGTSTTSTKWVQGTNYPSNWTIVELATIGIAKAKLSTGSDVETDVTWVQLWENGPKWATINVGVASTSATGTDLYGGYYTWGGSAAQVAGSFTDGHNTGSADLSNTSNPITDTATKLWGNNWRMPTQAELQALKANCTWSASSAGCTVTGKGDYASGSIFLPFAGCFDYDYKTVSGAGSSGSYWSSTYYDDGENDSAYDMYFNSSTPSVSEHNRKYGYSVRAVLAN